MLDRAVVADAAADTAAEFNDYEANLLLEADAASGEFVSDKNADISS